MNKVFLGLLCLAVLCLAVKDDNEAVLELLDQLRQQAVHELQTQE